MPPTDPTPAIAYASLTGSADVSSATPLQHTNSAAPSANPPSPSIDNGQLTIDDANPQSAIPNPQFPDPIAQAFAPLFDAPERHPGGLYAMPPIPREARTREASYERLSYVACRSELVLVDWIDRLAVTGVASHHDIDTFERATMILWRLTAIRKSLDARSQNPNAPDIPQLEAELSTGSADVSSAPPLADQPAPPSPTCNEPQPTTNEQQTTANATSHNPQSTIRNPQSPAAPSVPPTLVRAVPTCPTPSPQGLETFLARNEADIASLTGSADALVRNPAPTHQSAPASTNVPPSTLDRGPLPSDNAAPAANSDAAPDDEEDALTADEAPSKPAPCGGNCMECLKNQTCEACTVENPPDMNDPPERDAFLRWTRRRKRASPP